MAQTVLAQTSGAVFFLWLLAAAGAGAGAVWAWVQLLHRGKLNEKEVQARRLVEEAEQRRAEVVRAAEVEAQKKFLDMKERFEQETAETRNELRQAEKRLEKREDNLDKKLDVLQTKERKIEDAEKRLTEESARVEARQTELNHVLDEQRRELLNISRLSESEAREMCLQRVSQEVEHDAAQLIENAITTAQDTAQERARKIVIEAIQRYAAEHTCETVVATVDVPSDDMKGRIIGREGRNIRAFEKATGVTVIVDDTPGVVSVSCFDPVRREISRQSLERLITDGRIHPTRIEEIVGDVTKKVEAQVIEAGKHAAMEAKVLGLNKRIIEVLGRLQFRTSYGQNVLRHSIEVAYLCGMMAEELGLDGKLARRCGLLHDIGKGLAHDEAEGSHTKTGLEFVKRFNEEEAVLNAVGGHHGDIPATTPYTPLVTAADAISASRPGGRRESLERYIKRLEELESIATSFGGVEQAFAIEAGREVRVIVDALRIDDGSSLKLARDVAKKIEESMQFPGEIRVTVLREVRATEYAISGRHRE